MANTKRTVLITGCTDGSIGSALAIAFHKAGLHVYATARNTAKMDNLSSLGIETLELDVASQASITACVSKLSGLDMLVNNAGSMLARGPVSDLDILAAKELFELNVWSPIAVTQAFLPLLIKSPHGAIIANQTSTASLIPLPFQSAYNASKSAIAMFTHVMRLELAPFGIKVVELKTSLVKSNAIAGGWPNTAPLPHGSIFEPAREVIDPLIGGGPFIGGGQDLHEYANGTVEDLLKEDVPVVIYKGEGSDQVPLISLAPGATDDFVKGMVGMDKIEELILQHKK